MHLGGPDMLAAAEEDDVGAVHDDDEERTYPHGWSSSYRESVAWAPVRRRQGGVWLRARVDPGGAESPARPGRHRSQTMALRALSP